MKPVLALVLFIAMPAYSVDVAKLRGELDAKIKRSYDLRSQAQVSCSDPKNKSCTDIATEVASLQGSMNAIRDVMLSVQRGDSSKLGLARQQRDEMSSELKQVTELCKTASYIQCSTQVNELKQAQAYVETFDQYIPLDSAVIAESMAKNKAITSPLEVRTSSSQGASTGANTALTECDSAMYGDLCVGTRLHLQNTVSICDNKSAGEACRSKTTELNAIATELVKDEEEKRLRARGSSLAPKSMKGVETSSP